MTILDVLRLWSFIVMQSTWIQTFDVDKNDANAICKTQKSYFIFPRHRLRSRCNSCVLKAKKLIPVAVKLDEVQCAVFFVLFSCVHMRTMWSGREWDWEGVEKYFERLGWTWNEATWDSSTRSFVVKRKIIITTLRLLIFFLPSFASFFLLCNFFSSSCIVSLPHFRFCAFYCSLRTFFLLQFYIRAMCHCDLRLSDRR